MRVIRRYGLIVVASTAILGGLMSSVARADGLYSVTDLGSASPSAAYLSGQNQLDPSGNYLGALSPGQQAAFQAGSFDVYAHPATGWNAASQQNPDQSNAVVNDANLIISTIRMVTANNLGSFAGTGFVGRNDTNMIVTFIAAPHTVAYDGYSQYSWDEKGMPSNGYLNLTYTNDFTHFNTFYGSISGLNDHNSIAITETTYGAAPAPTYTIAIQTPHLVSGASGDLSLGSLGGVNGIANALNNANQVVGWSQIASGAQHAFLYSNGTMQDLNLLIPPLSGITLISAVGIDSAGEIVAYGTDASGQTHEYLLTPQVVPTPEPSTLAVMSLMIVAVAARQARARIRNK